MSFSLLFFKTKKKRNSIFYRRKFFLSISLIVKIWTEWTITTVSSWLRNEKQCLINCANIHCFHGVVFEYWRGTFVSVGAFPIYAGGLFAYLAKAGYVHIQWPFVTVEFFFFFFFAFKTIVFTPNIPKNTFIQKITRKTIFFPCNKI